MRSQGERKAPESWKGILHVVTAFPSDGPCIVKITCLWNRKESCLPSPLGFCLFLCFPHKKRALNSVLTSFKDVFKTVILHGNRRTDKWRALPHPPGFSVSSESPQLLKEGRHARRK